MRTVFDCRCGAEVGEETNWKGTAVDISVHCAECKRSYVVTITELANATQ